MAGVTIAHQHVSNEITTEDNFSDSFPGSMTLDSDNQVVDNEQLEQLLAAQWPTALPVEDLTGEVQDLMMRESMNSWLQPWVGENGACLTDLDMQIYAQSMQLGELFGQDQLNFIQDMNQSAFYDELAFAADDAQLESSAPCSSASSPSDSSAQISPIVQPATDVHIDHIDEEIIVEKLEALEQEQPVDVMIEEETVEIEEESIVGELAVEIPAEVRSNMLKRRRSSTSSEDSTDESSSEEESDSEDENVIPTTVANMNNRRRVSYSSSSDSESDSEPNYSRRSHASSPVANPYIYMHKRQIEETLLDRITNNLNPEKLPGILPILQSEKASNQQEDEVEIDLSCLTREQLVQVLSYVDACILEQNGGPAVNVEHYIMKKPIKGLRTHPTLNTEEEETSNCRPTKSRSRKPAKPKTKTRAELTEDIDGDSSASESIEYDSPSNVRYPSSHGPISMASLSKKAATPVKANGTKGGRKRSGNKSSKTKSRRKGGDDATVSSSVHVIQDPDSIASSRPKRRAAIHKRRLLEEMLAPSDNEAEEDSEDSVLVVYSDEQMDLDVVDNRTIMHQADAPVQLISTESEVVAIATSTVIEIEGSEDTDEEIDIMC